MNKSDFWYDLPEELIAQTPIDQREQSRLLCLDRNSGDICHHRFFQLPDLLNSGDCIVMNDSRVIPARLLGNRENGGAAEVVLLCDMGESVWECLVRPGSKIKTGARLFFGKNELTAIVTGVTNGGNRLIKFDYDGEFSEVLEHSGKMPLPPYIHEELKDNERYQTVYSRVNGSAAAPTAGLHFTEELMAQLDERGVGICFLTLHVGLGTFRPVKTETVEEHMMHTEFFTISSQTAETINRVKKNGGRIIAVGTTSCRALETVASATNSRNAEMRMQNAEINKESKADASCNDFCRDDRPRSSADPGGFITPFSGYTDIFIYPGYEFKCIDGLITNFHLPESTLIMLVSAFAGRENVLRAYNEAIRERYRFFSFGDAMLII